MKKYKIILADPPWQFKNYNDDKSKHWAGDHYGLMTTEDICKMPIKDIADDDCILFIWGTFPKLPDCLEVIKSWGFTYKTLGFIWYKTTKDNDFVMGMGYWTRSNTEYCLLATKGNPKRINASISQIIKSPRLKHSEKPPIIRQKIIELMGDLSRVELFARQRFEGWDIFGNEAPNQTQVLLSQNRIIEIKRENSEFSPNPKSKILDFA